MSMVGGLDLHRRQITFDVVERETGEVWRGRLWQPDRLRFRRWLAEELAPRAGGGPVELAVEGCTGWRYVVEEIAAAGFGAHLAEPAETHTARGNKKRAKTDRSDARLLRELLEDGRLPASWIPPTAVLEWRERGRLYKALMDQRAQWSQRIHAELFHHGVAIPEAAICAPATRQGVAELVLSPAARDRIAVAYAMIDATEAHAGPLRAELRRFGRAQPACRALVEAHYGIGPLVVVPIWAELGDCRRFASSDDAVRHSGLDVTVSQSDRRRSHGHLSRQGPGALRWALYEAANCASRPGSPDHDYYRAAKARLDGKRATISVARKLARRCYHTLRNLDPEVVYAMVD